MLIFVEKVNERLTYSFDFIFKERDLSYVFTSSESEFEKSLGPKFNYSKKNIVNTASITPSKMLFDDGKITTLEYNIYIYTHPVGEN